MSSAYLMAWSQRKPRNSREKGETDSCSGTSFYCKHASSPKNDFLQYLYDNCMMFALGIHMQVIAFGDVNFDTIVLLNSTPDFKDEICEADLHFFAGGCAANFSVAISRLGHEASFVGSVGDDWCGSFLVKEFRKDKVQTEGICQKTGQSGMTFILVERKMGHRLIFYSLGVQKDTSLCMRACKSNLIKVKEAQAVHVYAPLSKAFIYALKYAKKEGRLTSVDCSVAQIVKTNWDYYVDFIRNCDICFMSQGSLRFKELGSLMRQMLKQGCRYIVSTLGNRGCYVLTKNEKLVIPSFGMRAVDTTGAGDAFQAGFIVGLLENMELTSIARFANAVGALTVKTVGPRTSPKRQDVQKVLSSVSRAI